MIGRLIVEVSAAMCRHLKPFCNRTLEAQWQMDNEAEALYRHDFSLPLSRKISRSCSERLRTPEVALQLQ
jgi:hypothetical protein